jgi:hypothetical protein
VRHTEPTHRTNSSPLGRTAVWLGSIELLEAVDDELGRERAEAIRVAYVAATRARDLLVVPTCGDQPIEGWLEVLDSMLYPPDDARRRSGPAPGCPQFGDDSVVDRGPESTARSGLAYTARLPMGLTKIRFSRDQHITFPNNRQTFRVLRSRRTGFSDVF